MALENGLMALENGLMPLENGLMAPILYGAISPKMHSSSDPLVSRGCRFQV